MDDFDTTVMVEGTVIQSSGQMFGYRIASFGVL